MFAAAEAQSDALRQRRRALLRFMPRYYAAISPLFADAMLIRARFFHYAMLLPRHAPCCRCR